MSGRTVSSSPSRCCEHRRVRARRVRALRDLRELVRVAEQDEVSRRRADRERVGERDLPGLVDEERVDAAGRAPRARRGTTVPAISCSLLVEHRRRCRSLFSTKPCRS